MQPGNTKELLGEAVDVAEQLPGEHHGHLESFGGPHLDATKTYKNMPHQQVNVLNENKTWLMIDECE